MFTFYKIPFTEHSYREKIIGMQNKQVVAKTHNGKGMIMKE